MARSQAAQQLMADLDAELAANGEAAGTTLQWSAAEAAVLQLISDHVDRREDLQAEYDATKKDQVRIRIALATEIRLIESSIERMLRHVNTSLPQPMSLTSVKAQRAVRARWDRERLKQQAAGS